MAQEDKNEAELRTTALHGVHVASNGTMVDFGGWEMPLWYPSGAVKEHMAVLTGAGLFDTGHMSVIMAKGNGIRAFLNFAVTKDISALRVGRAGYGAILDASGFSLDDCIVYPLEEDRFALIVNAGMGEKVVAHMRALPGGEDFTWTELTARTAKIDIQGPESFAVLRRCVADPATVFASFPYFSFQGDFDFSLSAVFFNDGTPALLSRTGYTGELGFEIFVPADKAVTIWSMLLEAGKNVPVIPCGLAARDSLRTGSVLPLSHQDIGNWPFINHPWPFALPLDESGSFTKPFHGSSALDAARADHTLTFVGNDPRKVAHGEGNVVYQGEEIGTVLTCVADMSLGRLDGRVVGLNSPDKPEGWRPKGLVCGFIKVSKKLEPGTIVTLRDARREIPVVISTDVRPGRTARKALPKQ